MLIGGLNLAMVVFCQTIPAWRAQEKTEGKKEDFWLFHDNVIICILILGSVMAGLGQAFVWVIQGEYMSECSTPHTKGFYFGYCWALFMTSEIIGNWMGSILILESSGPSFFLIMGSIMVVAVLSFMTLRKPV